LHRVQPRRLQPDNVAGRPRLRIAAAQEIIKAVLSQIDAVVVGPKHKGQIESVNAGLRPDNHPVKRPHIADPHLGILILAEAISRPKGIIVAVLDIHSYLVIDDDQVVFRRQRLRPIGS
jgi:hypothetical protein